MNQSSSETGPENGAESVPQLSGTIFDTIFVRSSDSEVARREAYAAQIDQSLPQSPAMKLMGMTEYEFALLTEGEQIERIKPVMNALSTADWIESFISIIAKEGTDMHKALNGKTVGRMMLNNVQREICEAVDEHDRAGVPFRGIFLKCRQMGSTTLCKAIAVHRMITRANYNCKILGHNGELLKNAILKGLRIMMLYLPSVMQAPLGRDSASNIQYEHPWNSRISASLASAGQVGDTIHCAICTEASRYNELEQGLGNRTHSEFGQSVPNAAGTVWIYESTPYGDDGFFKPLAYQAYVAAQNKTGDSAFTLYFFAWHRFTDYVLDYSPKHQPAHWAPNRWKDDETEAKMRDKYCLTTEQLRWRRHKMREFGGMPDDQLRAFKISYPTSEEDAFEAQGANVFPVAAIDRDLQRCREDAEQKRLGEIPRVRMVRHTVVEKRDGLELSPL